MRTQTTFTFKSQDNAERFKAYLLRNRGNSDIGCPRFVDLREVGRDEWCVEFEADGGADYVRGVAYGIDLA